MRTSHGLKWGKNIKAKNAPLIKSIFKTSSDSTPPLAPLPEELPSTGTTPRFVSGVSI